MARLESHPNIVQMLEVIRCDNDWAFFVFEYMPGGDLLRWKECHRHNGTLPRDTEIGSILQQLLRGLAYMHSHAMYHRDLKPENILMDGNVCKIADFSLARSHDETEAVTEYVSTRWYRAPEVALACRSYAEPVDLFALGAIAMEVYTLKVLFPAKNELELLTMMFTYLGTPDASGWEEGAKMLRHCQINISQQDPAASPFRSVQTSLPSPHNQKTVTIDLLVNLLALDPSKRLSAAQALEHPFFVGFQAEDIDQPTLCGATTVALNHLHSGNQGDEDRIVPSHATPRTNSLPLQERQKHALLNMVTVSPPNYHKSVNCHMAATTLRCLPDDELQVIRNPYSIAATSKRQKPSS